jgi:adenylate cyclase
VTRINGVRNLDQPARKFRANLHADVVGSTELVQRDEALAHTRMQQAFRTLATAIEAYRGTTHELRGDALVAEFERPSDAVAAALRFQADNIVANQRLTDNLCPLIRIGISLGEVIVADGTLTGAGVILAQRVEQLAEPNGVCITGAVREAVPAHFQLRYQDLGRQALKGFEEPVQVYSVSVGDVGDLPSPQPEFGSISAPRYRKVAVVAGAVLVLAVAMMFGWKWLSEGTSGSPNGGKFAVEEQGAGTPSIAVLPFENQGADPEQDYFAEGITADLTTDLSKLSGLFVVARDSSQRHVDSTPQDTGRALGVRYVLRGSVRKAGNDVRINVELIEASTNGNIWADRYDGTLQNVFALQDRVTRRIVDALAVTLTEPESAGIARRWTDDPIAYDFLLRGNALLGQFSANANSEARNRYSAAIERDPGFARAFGGVAISHAYDARFRWVADPQESLRLALTAGRTAVRLAPDLAQAHFAEGVVLTYLRRSDEAIAAAERAIRLNPQYADAHVLHGFALLNSGRAEAALTAVETAFRINPEPPALYLMHRGRVLFFLERYADALTFLKASINQNPGFLLTQIYLSATHAMLGQVDEAEWSAMEVLNLAPEFSIDVWSANEIFTDPSLSKDLAAALVASGLPR